MKAHWVITMSIFAYLPANDWHELLVITNHIFYRKKFGVLTQNGATQSHKIKLSRHRLEVYGVLVRFHIKNFTRRGFKINTHTIYESTQIWGG